jgi:hypothetical protein
VQCAPDERAAGRLYSLSQSTLEISLLPPDMGDTQDQLVA